MKVSFKLSSAQLEIADSVMLSQKEADKKLYLDCNMLPQFYGRNFSQIFERCNEAYSYHGNLLGYMRNHSFNFNQSQNLELRDDIMTYDGERHPMLQDGAFEIMLKILGITEDQVEDYSKYDICQYESSVVDMFWFETQSVYDERKEESSRCVGTALRYSSTTRKAYDHSVCKLNDVFPTELKKDISSTPTHVECSEHPLADEPIYNRAVDRSADYKKIFKRYSSIIEGYDISDFIEDGIEFEDNVRALCKKGLASTRYDGEYSFFHHPHNYEFKDVSNYDLFKRPSFYVSLFDEIDHKMDEPQKIRFFIRRLLANQLSPCEFNEIVDSLCEFEVEENENIKVKYVSGGFFFRKYRNGEVASIKCGHTSKWLDQTRRLSERNL